MDTMSPPIEYVPFFVEDVFETYRALMGLAWERRGDAPRFEYYCNDTLVPYVYGRGKGRREYFPKPYVPEVLKIRKKLEDRTGVKLDVCFLNFYQNQSDHLGWHADDSPEMDPERPIVTVSVGVSREIWFRPIVSMECPSCSGEKMLHGSRCISRMEERKVYGTVTKVLLEPGSACIMAPGMQGKWEHRIPKADRKCGERISLTFRGYKHP
jgi:alkylated DNA repair dioxygenase AlkB